MNEVIDTVIEYLRQTKQEDAVVTKITIEYAVTDDVTAKVEFNSKEETK